MRDDRMKTFPIGAVCLMMLWACPACRSFNPNEHTLNEAGKRSPGSLEVTNVFDLKNRPVNPFHSAGPKAMVLIFVRTDCPISNRYAPEIQRLYQKYASQGISFWLVYPEPDTSAAEITQHSKEYRLSLPALRDVRHSLVRKAGVRVTPEAAVFSSDGREIYRGRIDDRFVDFGKERPAPTQRDLDAALRSVLDHAPMPSRETLAVGCYISDLLEKN
ncbi:MAG: hypothetical protein QOJ40_454 [Verrucomicrobiota bacterium]